MNEREFADKYLREVRPRKGGREIEAKYCPFCNGGRHMDQYTFSINIDKHTYVCMRGKCNERGTFKELCEKYNEQADYYLEWLKENKKEYIQAREYTQPKYQVNDLTDSIISYFEKRCISKDVLIRTGVRSVKNFNQEYAVFQFFEGDKLVMNKLRLPREARIVKGKKEQKEWKEPGGKHVLWNMNNIDTEKPVVLTEGMIDALSVIEAGYENTVSIPSGTNDMTWIENCYEWIQKVKEWVLYTDNDEAGYKLTEELKLKFKTYKTRIVQHELKDANEELKVLGPDYILSVIDKAEFPAIQGINNLARVDIVDPAKMERILTGVSLIDQYSGGYIFPSLNVWTGERGSGKSTVVGQTLLNCIEKGYNVFVYTGELMAGYFKLWLYLQASGEKNVFTEIDMEINRQMHRPNPEVVKKIDKWIDGKMYIYDDTNTNEEDKIFEMMEEAYNRYNCRVFLLDNLMTVKFNANRDGVYRAQSDFVDRLRNFVKNNNLIVNLVVHPNKSGEIGGAGDIRNAAFNEFWVKRVKEENNLPDHDTIISITKNRYYSDTEIERPYKFSKKSKRIYERFEDEKTYNWTGNNGLQEVEIENCPF